MKRYWLKLSRRSGWIEGEAVPPSGTAGAVGKGWDSLERDVRSGAFAQHEFLVELFLVRGANFLDLFDRVAAVLVQDQ